MEQRKTTTATPYAIDCKKSEKGPDYCIMTYLKSIAMQKTCPVSVIVLFILFSQLVSGQAQPQLVEVAAPEVTQEEDGPLKVFLDCGVCDMNYLRQEVSYIRYVRDPALADVHILVTSSPTGANAYNHVLDFIGKGQFSEEKINLTFNEPPNATQEQRRQGIAQKLELGLVPYWINTHTAEHVRIKVEEPGSEKSAPKQKEDPWNFWIFEISGGGAFNKESAKSAFNVWASVSANRITEEWRIRNRAFMRHDQRTFKDDNEGDIVSIQKRKFLSSQAVYSLSNHWSTGLSLFIDQNSYENIDFGVRAAPAVEFSLYPYQEVNRREVTIAYRINYLYRDYQQMTIFQKFQETLWSQAIDFSARFRQPWGSLFAGIEGSHFIDDISKYRIQVDGYLSLRVTSGLSLQVGGDMAFIKDQRSLPAGEASLEDLLLSQRQLATNYRFSGSIGLTYTFGSIFNDVVNTRL